MPVPQNAYFYGSIAINGLSKIIWSQNSTVFFWEISYSLKLMSFHIIYTLKT